MSGRCVPPAKGSFSAHTSPGAGSWRMTAATASGIAPRWTGMCSACDDHAATVVEQRGRAVATLLDVRRERGADEHRAHLLRDRAQRAADHLQLDGDHRTRSRTSVPCASVSPAQPSGTQQVAPSSTTSSGPDTRRRSAARSSRAGPGADIGRAHRDELNDAPAVGVPVALLVHPVEALVELRPRAAPTARTTGRGSEGSLRPPPEARRRRRADRGTSGRGRAARRLQRARRRRAHLRPPARAPRRSRAPPRARRRGAARRRRMRRARSSRGS